MVSFPIIIEQEYNDNNSTFSFRKMGDKRIFNYIQGDSFITITKGDELHLSVKEAIIILQQFRDWLFKIRELYLIPFGVDETFSVKYLINENCTLSFNEVISFEYNKNDLDIKLISFNVPINISLITILRRTQEILNWIKRDFAIWDTPLYNK